MTKQAVQLATAAGIEFAGTLSANSGEVLGYSKTGVSGNGIQEIRRALETKIVIIRHIGYP